MVEKESEEIGDQYICTYEYFEKNDKEYAKLYDEKVDFRNKFYLSGSGATIAVLLSFISQKENSFINENKVLIFIIIFISSIIAILTLISVALSIKSATTYRQNYKLIYEKYKGKTYEIIKKEENKEYDEIRDENSCILMKNQYKKYIKIIDKVLLDLVLVCLYFICFISIFKFIVYFTKKTDLQWYSIILIFGIDLFWLLVLS